MVQQHSLGHIDRFFLHGLLEDLAIELGTVVSVLDHSRHLDSTRPVVIVEALEVGETENGILVQGGVVGQLDVAGRGAGALGHVLGHHEELESTGR